MPLHGNSPADMELLRQQVQAIHDELQTVRGELVNMKAAHATLHQSATDTGTSVRSQEARLQQLDQQLQEIATDTGTTTTTHGTNTNNKHMLIEAKQVSVDKFSGNLTDSRGKFIQWTERLKDKAALYSDKMVEAMNAVAQSEVSITMEKSEELGLKPFDNLQLQGFLKDRTDATAHALVRGNRTGVALESYRLLCKEFNPITLQGTITAQHYEQNPRKASKLSELPARLLE